MLRFSTTLLLLTCFCKFLELPDASASTDTVIKYGYTHYQSKAFLQNTKRRGKFPDNFHQYLAPFSRCLIQVINFEGLNFYEPPEYPLVLTRREVVYVYEAGVLTRLEILPVEKLLLLQNHTFLDRVLKRPSTVDRTFKMRPRLCDAHIYLHPPNKADNKLPQEVTPELLEHAGLSPFANFYQIIADEVVFTISSFQVRFWNNLQALLQRRAQREIIMSHFESFWRYDILVASTRFDGKMTWINGLFLHKASTYNFPTATWELLHWKTAKGTVFEAAIIVQDCFDKNNIAAPHCEVRAEMLTKDKDKLARSFYQIHSVETRHLWILDTTMAGIKPKGRFPLYPRGSKKLDMFFNFPTALDLKVNHQRLLYYALGNASYLSVTTENGGPSSVTPLVRAVYPVMMFTQTSTDSPMRFSTQQKKMRFIACGHQKGKAQFLQLVASYDILSWTAILFIGILGVAVAQSCFIVFSENISSRKEVQHIKIEHWHLLGRHLTAAVKNLVEQGYFEINDRKYVTRHASVRITMTVTILMGVIISQAFQGDNITKIVSPIPPIPFTHLEQLVNTSYEIFSSVRTSAEVYTYLNNFGEIYKELQACAECNTTQGAHHFRFRKYVKGASKQENEVRRNLDMVVCSEIANMYASCDWAENQSNESREVFLNSPSLSPSQRYVVQHSKLVPTTLTFDQWYNLTCQECPIMPDCEELGRAAVLVKEETYLDSKKLYNVEYENYAGSPMSFGKAVIASTIEGFIWRGRIPAKALMKMTSLYTSGIMNYHAQYVERYYENAKMLLDFPVKSRRFQAASLEGSIKVIFVILPIGILPSLLMFTIERVKGSAMKQNAVVVLLNVVLNVK